MRSFLVIILTTLVLKSEGSLQEDFQAMLQFIDIPQYIHTNALEKGVSINCSRDVHETAIALSSILSQGNHSEDTMWAVRVMDSMPSIIAGGLLTGNLWQLGHFDECLDSVNPNGIFTGQHCVLNLEMDILEKALAGTKFEQYHPTYRYGVCLPSTCSIDDINLLANNFSTTYLATATEENCWTKDKTWKLDNGDWAVLIVIIIIVAATILSTLYEGLKIINKNDKVNPILSSFSAIKNSISLFSIRKGGIPCVDGLRVGTIMWILDTHVYLNYAYVPMTNAKDNEEDLDSESYVLAWNGMFASDTFLFLSGLLAAMIFLRVYAIKKYYDAPLYMIHRFLRLTPTFAMVIAIAATIFRTFGKGPNWYQAYEYLQSSCQEKWWSSLLYVSNYLNPETMCIYPSWFLSVDMQMYWISPLLLYPVVLWPKVGAFLLFAVTIGSAFLTFGLDQAKELYMNVRQGGVPQWSEDYITTHTRAAPWLVGASLAVIFNYQMFKKIKVKMSKRTVLLGWTFSTVCCLGSLLSSFRFLHDRPFTWMESAAYLAFTRFGWGLGMAWIVYACQHGYGGPANWILSLPLFQPLGKLSFSVFLTHDLVQKFRTGLIRNSYYQTELTQAYLFFGDYAISTCLAYLLYITVEAPFVNIDKILFGNLKIFPFPPPKSTKNTKLDDQSQEHKNGAINENTTNVTIEHEEKSNMERKITLEMSENCQEPAKISNEADNELKTAL